MPEPPRAVLIWRVHLAADDPGRAVLVVAAACTAAMLCQSLFLNWLFSAFSCLVLLGATAEFLFPIHFRLDESGAEMRNLHNWRRIAWVDVKKAYLLEDGVKLSPLAVPSRLEHFRGVFLRFGEGEGSRESVLTAVKQHRNAVGSRAD